MTGPISPSGIDQNIQGQVLAEDPSSKILVVGRVDGPRNVIVALLVAPLTLQILLVISLKPVGDDNDRCPGPKPDYGICRKDLIGPGRIYGYWGLHLDLTNSRN